MQIDTPLSTAEQIAERIAQQLNPKRIVLFGSRARGDDRPDSDVDLMVEMETSLPPAERMREVHEVCGNRAVPLDLVVFTPEEVARWRNSMYSIIGAVEREGRVLYERPG